MAIDPFWGGLANAGATLAVGGGNLISDIIFNKQRKELQEKIFQREDTAVQRRAADLEAAGLSKTLAAGGSAQAGPVVSMNAPKWEGENPANSFITGKMQAMQLQTVDAQNKLLMYQADKAKADADKQNLENDVFRQTMQGDIGAKNANADVAMRSAANKLSLLSLEETQQALKNANLNLDLTLKEQQIKENEMNAAILNVKRVFEEQFGMERMKAELAAKQLANEITKYNKDWYQTLKLPVSGSADIWTKLAGVVGQLTNEKGFQAWWQNLTQNLSNSYRINK